MITKAEIAEIFKIDATDIPDKVYDFAVQRFYELTGFSSEDQSLTYEEIVGEDKYIFQLETPVKSIDSIVIDDTSLTLTENSTYRIDKNRGLLQIVNGVSAGSKVKITYTKSAYTHTTLCDYLITLLTYQALSLFCPDVINFVDSVRIGSYAKRYGSIENLQDNLDREIKRVIDLIKGRHDEFGFESV